MKLRFLLAPIVFCAGLLLPILAGSPAARADTASPGPVITNISITSTPSPLPAAGGTATVTATITDSGGSLDNVYAYLLLNGSSTDYVTLSSSDGTNYTGTATVGGNDTNAAETYTAEVIAYDSNGQSSQVTSTDSITENNDPTPPSITNAAITSTPASPLPPTGGTINITATVDDPTEAIATYGVLVDLYQNGNYYTDVYLSNSGSGDVYTGAVTVYNNTSGATDTYAAKIIATNAPGATTTVTAAGTITQSSDNSPPTVTAALTGTPSPMTDAGGTLTVTANVSDPTETINDLYALVFQDGVEDDSFYVDFGAPVGGIYTGTVSLPANTDTVAHTYTMRVTAENALGLSATTTASGAITEPNNHAPLTITNAQFSSTTSPIPATGGPVTITAQVDAPSGHSVQSVTANILAGQNEDYYTQVTMTNGGSGDIYTGTVTLYGNSELEPLILNAKVTATNELGLATTALASGTVTEANDPAPPVLSALSFSASSVPASGGTLTVTATVADPTETVNSVDCEVYQGNIYTADVTLSNGGSGNVYTGTVDIGANTTASTLAFTGVVSAFNTVGVSASATIPSGFTQAGGAAALQVTAATLSPPNLSASGGMVTVTATVPNPSGVEVSSVDAEVQSNLGDTYYLTLTQNGSGDTYSGTATITANAGSAALTFTATVTATNVNTTSAPPFAATGTVTEAAGSAPPTNPPAITNAFIGSAPSPIPATGGTVSVTATVTPASGATIDDVEALIFKNGQLYTEIGLASGGGGSPPPSLRPADSGANDYTGGFYLGGDTDSSADVYTAVIVATDSTGATATAPVSGSVTQNSDPTPPTITNAAITSTPASPLPATGGTINITANVDDSTEPVNDVYVSILRDGVPFGYAYLSNTGGDAYSGTYNPPDNTDSTAHTYTAVVLATNEVDNTSQMTASGSVTENGDNSPVTITNATLSSTPASPLSAGGGTLTLTAQIDAPAGHTVSGVYGEIYANGSGYSGVYMTNSGGGDIYTGTATAYGNDSGLSLTFAGTVTAANELNLVTTVNASGTVTQTTDTTPPTITNATLSSTPASPLPPTGGQLTITAQVDDAATPIGTYGVTAVVYRDGVSYYSTTLYGTTGSDIYTGTVNLGHDIDPGSHVYTAVVNAESEADDTASLAAVGSVTQNGDATPPTITNASVSPPSLTPTGGTITVTATVTDPTESLYYVYADIYEDGFEVSSDVYMAAGAGGVYTGTFNAPTNSDVGSHTFTAVIITENTLYEDASLAATGQTVETGENQSPVITDTSISPANLPATGGQITVTGTVVDPGGLAITFVPVDLYKDGALYNVYFASTTGTGGVYTATINIPANTDPTTHTFTATMLATDGVTTESSLPVPGSTVIAAAVPPGLTSTSMLPANVPAAGGTVTLSATVTDAQGVQSVTAQVFEDGSTTAFANLTLNEVGTTAVYSGTFNLGANADTVSHSYAAVITATDVIGLTATANVGPTVQAAAVLNPVPTISSLSPSSALVGSPDLTLTLTGTGFLPITTVTFGALTGLVPDAATLTATQMTVTVPANALTTAGTVNVTATNPAPGGGVSTPPTPFAINNPVPAIVSLNPASIVAALGNPVTLTITGTGFIAASAASFTLNGQTTPLTTTYVNSTTLTATLPAALTSVVGTATITVTNPAPGGGVSAPATTLPITLDTMPPTTQILTGPAPGSTSCSASVTFTFSGTDPNFASPALTYQYSLDGAAFVSVGTQQTVTLSGLTDGSHTVVIETLDPAGLIDAAPPSVTFTVDTASPVISAVNAVPTPTGATITWTTDKPTTSQVNYGPTNAYGQSSALQSALTTSHSVTLTGLAAQTPYHFAVVSTDACTTATSPDAQFTTSAPQLPTLSVTALTFPTPVTAHQSVTISWNVLNTGPGDATQAWTDTLYLSPTATLNVNDPNTIALDAAPAPTALPAGAQYTQTQVVTLPGVPAGTYYLILAADSGSQIVQTTRGGDTLAQPIVFQKVDTLLVTPSQSALSLTVGTALPGSLTLTNMGDTALSGITATVTGAPANVGVTVNCPATLAPMSSVSVPVSVLANNASLLTGTATVTFSSSDGQQAPATLNLTVIPPKPTLTVTSNLLNGGALDSGMVLGQQTTLQCTVTNTGGATATDLAVTIPSEPWLALSSPASLGDLPPGQSASVVLTLSPAATLALGVYSGAITVGGANATLSIPFHFTALASGIGSMKIVSSDEFTYFANPSQPLTGATVTLTSQGTVPGTQIPVTLTNDTTDSTGTLTVPNLPAGPYQITVSAPDHENYTSTVLVTAGEESDVAAFLSRNLVTYQFTVVPITVTDSYQVTLQAIFQTNVPAPVVTISPLQVDLTKLNYNANGQATVYFTITNHGLIAADDVNLALPTRTDYLLTAPQTDFGTLGALSTVVVPVTITNTAIAPVDVSERLLPLIAARARADGVVKPNDGGCSFSMAMDDTYFCGKKITDATSVSFAEGSGCGGGGGVAIVDIGGGGPGGGVIFGSSIGSNTINICDKCTQAVLGAVGSCLLGFTPMPCLVSAAVGGWQCGAAIGGDISGQAVAASAGAKVTSDKATPLGSISPQGSVSAGTVRGCLEGMAGTLAGCAGAAPGIGAAINIISCADGIATAATTGPCAAGASGSALRANNLRANSSLKPQDGGIIATNPFVDQLQSEAQNLQAEVQPYLDILGDPLWLSDSGSAADGALLANFLSAFLADTNPGGVVGPISDTDAAALEAMPLPSQLTSANAIALVQRWNQSLTYYDEGIDTVAQVPAGGSTNFIDLGTYGADCQAALTAGAADQAEGFPNFADGLLSSEQQLQQEQLNQASQAGTCAEVVIQLDQTVDISRSAFQATLTLNNAALNGDLTNVQVNLHVTDINGNDQTALFGITPPTLTNFDGDLDGTGTLPSGDSGTAQWTITPGEQAAINGSTQYYVGGTISYQENGTTITIPFYPTPITVIPDPNVQLHYFLQQQVYGPDPNDPFNVNTPPEPFSLGLLAANIGAGDANNFTITTSQPQIVANDKGLDIAFEVIGTQVDSQQISPSLEVNFGDLTPVGTAGSTGSAQFLLTASLAGQFVGYGATFQQTDDLGDNTSLIDSVDIHSLEHVVRNLWPLDDGKPDFLADDIPNAVNLPDTLWSSDNTTYPVTSSDNAQGDPAAGSTFGFSSAASLDGLTTTLTIASPASGYVYFRTDDPSQGNLQLLSVTRSDGTVLQLGTNVWTTDRNVHLSDGTELTEHRLYIFDYNTTGTYTLVYGQSGPANEPIGGLKQLGDGVTVAIGLPPASSSSGSTGGSGGTTGGAGGTGTGGTGTGGLAPSGPVVVTAVFPGSMYVEALDRSSGIKVEPAEAAVGDLVTVTGTLATDTNGERYIAKAQTSVVGNGVVAPLGLTVKSLYGGDNLNQSGVGQVGVTGGAGLNPVGLLTETLGQVVSTGGSGFTLDDGFGNPVDVLLPSGDTALPTIGSFVAVTDITSLQNITGGRAPLLLPRNASDINTDVSGLASAFSAPAGTLHNGPNLFALPGIPSDPVPNDVLAQITGGAAALLTGNLARFDAPTQGEVFYDPSTAPFNLLLGEGYALTLSGAPTSQPNFSGYGATFADHWISLPAQGATWIGDPFDQPIDWADVMVTNGDKTVSLADAARTESPAWISSSAQYTDATGALDQILGLPDDTPAPTSSQLTPWTGYIVSSSLPNLALIVPESPAPVVQGLTPSTVQASGPAFVLTVSGINFGTDAVVNWNGAALATTFVSATQLTATVPAGDIAAQGSDTVTVTTGGMTSNGLPFTVTPAPVVTPNPVPTLTALAPNSAPAGSLDTTVTLTGTNFVSASVVNWNGTALITTFVSATQLTATIPAADLTASALAQITVVTPAPGGGTSAALPFQVVPAGLTDVSASVQVISASLTYNPIKHTFTGTLQVTNIGSAALPGPLQVVLTGLPTGITLTDAAGTYQGQAYVTIPGPLAVGASATVSVQFLRPTTVTAGVSYGTQVFQGNFP